MFLLLACAPSTVPPAHADSCGSIGNADLRYYCSGSCGSIGDADVRCYGQKSCGSIGDADLRYLCQSGRRYPGRR